MPAGQGRFHSQKQQKQSFDFFVFLGFRPSLISVQPPVASQFATLRSLKQDRRDEKAVEIPS
jgi:hypothetical protein